MTLLTDCLLVGIGGFIGSILRYLLGFLPIGQDSGFPFITLFINTAGALLIGFLVVYFSRFTELSPQLLLLFKVGFCGGFTTFSAFSLESIQLFQEGNLMLGTLYVGLSVILCLGAVLLGEHLGTWVNAR